MKTITKTAIVALMTATTGLSAISPTFAQEAAPMQVQADNGPGFHLRRDNQGPGPMGGERGGDFLNFARGAEAIEVALVHLSHRIELTSEQQALFDTLKTTVLSAAADWRWLTQGTRSPWYPTMTLFRQSALGRWDEVRDRVGAALAAWRQERTPA